MKRKVVQSSTMTKRRVILSLYVSEITKSAQLYRTSLTIIMGINYEMQILR